MQLGNRKSQMSAAQVPSANIGRSRFNRSFTIKDTYNFDYLNPVFFDEVVPGDTKNITLNVFARLATQVVPIMDNLHVDFFFFFVPMRLLWTNWEKFMGAQDNPGDSISYVLPSLDAFPAGGPEVDTIYDKYGLPTDVTGAWTLGNTLPLRMYNLIYKTWFRDENLQNSPVINTDDGPDQIADYTLLKRGKRHDYFTSALPFLQKGTAVSMPLGTTAPVLLKSTPTTPWEYRNAATGALQGSVNAATNAAGTFSNAGNTTVLDPSGSLYADLTNATAATINQLRLAFQTQRFLETDARGGTRYVELLLAHFGVQSPDFRLQRPEYLGGGSTRINSHPVAQTAPTAGSAYAGSLSAFATTSTAGQNIGFTKSFVEHGYIICLMHARADITYQQGLHRNWLRSTRYDFFYPEFQEIGEQTITNQEIFKAGSGGTDTSTFGYQERYAEYRYMPSMIKGQFRSTYATPLDMWHMAEKFTTVPALNSTFIQSNTPITRALANTSAPHILFDCFVNYIDARPIVAYPKPAGIGRF